MRRGQHNSGLTGGPINGTKLPEAVIDVITAPEMPPIEELAPPPPSPPRVVVPVKPKIRPKGK